MSYICWSIIVLVNVVTSNPRSDELQPTANDIQQILKWHNDLRKNVEPGPPLKMPDLAWDETLAVVGRRWAEECVWAHPHIADPEFVSNNGGNASWTGENIYRADHGKGSWREAFDLYADEAKNYDYCIPKCLKGVCGHYTQAVWAFTATIGCGMSECTSGKMKDKDYYVCFYYPGGNLKKMKPYRVDTEKEKQYCAHKNITNDAITVAPANHLENVPGNSTTNSTKTPISSSAPRFTGSSVFGPRCPLVVLLVVTRSILGSLRQP